MTESVPDPVFNLIPKNSTFFLIWRIEKMQVVPLAEEDYGKFYNGDSYIVACATERGERADFRLKPRVVESALEMHIHFWLGDKTSLDESGIAAYKSVELDDYLGGSPIQHREVQGHESKRFLSYFKDGIRFLEGGVASGFHHVDAIKPALFRVKGKRSPIINELEDISWDHFNDGDVFILFTGTHVFLWSGKNANNMERIQGAKFAQELKSEHASHSVVVVDDGLERDELSSEERREFEHYLPLESKSVKKASELPDDLTLEMNSRKELKLYQVSDEDGTLKVIEVKMGPLEQSDLNSMDSFLIDNNRGGIWIWIGKKATKLERVEAMRNAQAFTKKKGYKDHTHITRVIDGAEPHEFKSMFKSWTELYESTGMGTVNTFTKIAKIIPDKFDTTTLHENHVLSAETQLVDDGHGKKEIYRIKEFDTVLVSEEDHGKFYAGDCYIILYTYGNSKTIIYYWIGAHSTVDERGTAAMKTVEMDNSRYNGTAVQVRVVQGKEPPSFMIMFQGKMVIYQGGFASGFNNALSEEAKNSETYLLQVRGTAHFNTKAIQVDCVASSLNSNDVFVLFTPNIIYIWAGKGSLGDEREMAKTIVSEAHGREVEFVSEGQEKEEFWEAIGGKDDYSNDKRLQISEDPHMPRLFQCSNASGRFIIEEIVNFDQSDLIEDDIMLLDAWDALFLWIGSLSNASEKKLAADAAIEYLRTDPSGRDQDTPILIVKQGHEPANFTGFFGIWDSELWKDRPNFAFIKKGMRSNQAIPLSTLRSLSINGNKTDFDSAPKYSIEKLKTKEPILLPEDIDLTRKEIHLTSDDFKTVFNMSYKEFQAMPKWKQVDLKKKVGLF